MIEINVPWKSFVQADRKAGFALKDKAAQEVFKEYNSANPILNKVIENSTDIKSGGNKWFKEVTDFVFKCFRKVRFTKIRKDLTMRKLLEEKAILLRRICPLKQVL